MISKTRGHENPKFVELFEAGDYVAAMMYLITDAAAEAGFSATTNDDCNAATPIR